MKISELLSEDEMKILDRKRNLFGCLDLDYLDDILLTKAYLLDIKEYAALRLARTLVEIRETIYNINEKID